MGKPKVFMVLGSDLNLNDIGEALSKHKNIEIVEIVDERIPAEIEFLLTAPIREPQGFKYICKGRNKPHHVKKRRGWE